MATKEKATLTAATQRQGKDTHFRTQYQTVYQSFSERPKSRLLVSAETGILESNICRYVAKMEKAGQIQIIRQARCPCSRRKVEFLSTNKALFVNNRNEQLDLFDDGI